MRLARDPGLALCVLALGLGFALYAPTLGRGLVGYDDTWLVERDWIVQQHALGKVCCALDPGTRAVLGAEYLPVRDLSVMLDFAVFGRMYPGHHLTSVLIYLAAIALWFAALAAFGVDRRVAGLAVLVWAVHPAHAESVAWLAERKGLLGAAFAAACALGYARWRAGASARWLGLAMIAAVCAVWSKAPSALAIAALAGLELALPARRVSLRRSARGLAAIAAVGAAAFEPVVIVAARRAVVGAGDRAPAGWLAMALGIHGFYLRLAAMTVGNALSYPIRTAGPGALDLALGALGLCALAAALWRGSPVVRAAAVLWLFGWLPASRLVLPLRDVLVADRYLLVPTLGVALAIAAGVLAAPRGRTAIAAAIVAFASWRALDAQAAWHDGQTLLARAVASNPDDGDAWAAYADALEAGGQGARAIELRDRALARAPTARLELGQALAVMPSDPARGRALLERAAHDGEPYAMADLALVRLGEREPDDALAWARRATDGQRVYQATWSARCHVAAATGHRDEAAAACALALAIDPASCRDRCDADPAACGCLRE